MTKFIPDIKNLSLDDAKDTLDKSKIKYDDENIEERYSLLTRKGHVIETEPKIGSEVKKGDVVKLTISKLCLLPFILMMAAFIIGLIIIEKNTFSNIFKGAAPVISHTNDTWATSDLVYVSTDAKLKDGIDHYDVCILPDNDNDINKCIWFSTKTKNIEITKSGIWHTYFKGVDKTGNESKISNEIISKVDSEIPTVDDISGKVDDNYKLTIEVNSKDRLSGIAKSYYKINDGEFIEFKDRIEIENVNGEDKYIVTIKIVDEAGNEVEKTFDLSKEVHEAVKKIDEQKKLEENGQNGENSNGDSENNNGEFSSVGPLPSIDLDDVPTVIKGSSNYSLPSHYDFGGDLSGTYYCFTPVNNKRYTNTSELHIGTHTIACTIINELGYATTTRKTIKIEMDEGPDEVMDGWIKYNIYYPEGSTEWEWRLDVPDTIRTGYDTTDWQPYTGPILIRIEDIENVYIRYKLDDGTVVVPPKGRVLVDIEPDAFAIKSGDQTNVKIVYDENALIKEYRVNGGAWTTYEGPFKAEVNSFIEARATKDEDIYDADGNYVKTSHLQGTDQVFISEYLDSAAINRLNTTPNSAVPTIPGYVRTASGSYLPQPGSCVGNSCLALLKGPIITSNPSSGKVEETTITITTEEEAEEIYYRTDNSAFKLYTGPFVVNKNLVVTAYYIKKDNLQRSLTSFYYVNNIYVPGKPYVKIDVSPAGYLSEKHDELTVSISGSDYDTLEYSFDGIFYKKYTTPFKVTNSCTIYAKGVNDVGTTIETHKVVTINTPKPKDSLAVDIYVSPSKEEVVGLINEAEVTISYDSRATEKYYRIHGSSWQPYTGTFKINSNAIIEAYAISENGTGLDRYQVNYLTTGIAAPLIESSYAGDNYYNVKINYATQANNKVYRINGGEWLTYTTPIIVEGGSLIEAYNTDVLNNKASSFEYLQAMPRTNNTTQILDKGDYYLIRNNFPEGVDPTTRAYKWKEDGVWKSYNDDGWILIKQFAKDKYDLVNMTSFAAENSKGQKVTIPKQHVYVLDVPVNELMENVWIRFGTKPPSAPVITVTPGEDPSAEVEVDISYNSLYKTKKYKIVTPDGDSGWLDYTGTIKVNKNNTIIFAKSITSQEIEGNVASKKITNIDEFAPEVTFKGDFTTPARKVLVTVKATDNLAVGSIKYLKGNHSIEDFKDNGTYVGNNTAFKADENGTYTVYVSDRVGHEIVKTIEITNVDLNAPNIELNVLTETFGTNLEFEATYGDSVTKQYKLGKTGEWVDYTGKVSLTSYDVLDKKNADNSLTISLKGIDGLGNESEISEDVYILDLDQPTQPVITSVTDYATVKVDGVIFNNATTVTYDNRTDIINYYCLKDCDVENNWHIYEGALAIDHGILKVKSFKKNTGLTSENQAEINLPNDALSINAYDGLNTTKTTINNGSYRVNLDSSLWYSDLHFDGTVNTSTGNGTNQVIFYNSSNKQIGVSNLGGSGTLNQNVSVPSGAKYMKIVSGSDTNYYVTINEIYAIKITYYEGKSLLDIVNTKVKSNGLYAVAVNGELYKIHAYVLNGNQTITKNTTYGDEHDVGGPGTYASNMVVVKVNGDYTVNSGVTVGPFYNKYGGPKGFLLYVTGKLNNNGTIDNSHGAYAEGQNVYLWKNSKTNNYEFIPAVGSAGGNGIKREEIGNPGVNATGRMLAGGGSGGKFYANDVANGKGGTATSYSGGAGAGGQDSVAGSSVGGAGSDATQGYDGGGGAGNPGGAKYRDGTDGTNGTGGLLIIYSNEFINNGSLTAKGSIGGYGTSRGGSSGGGSINIFTNQLTNIDQLGIETDVKYSEILGNTNVTSPQQEEQYATRNGGKGGNGTVNIGEIRNGQYYDLKEIINQDKESYKESVTLRGESILSIVQNNNFSTGEHYYFFVANNIEYPVHLYVLNGNQTITKNTQYGDLLDCATGKKTSQMAKNMVVVKVNGDYTINSNVTVGPAYNSLYGGPKGFLLYVTGKLTNNGTIDNSHGAYAEGQNVYLWKNATGNYEYIPAVGSAGGNGIKREQTGNSGVNATGRMLAGGGSGGKFYANDVANGKGGTATSYSGGAGAGGQDSVAGSSVGGAGSDATQGYDGGGGAGNPGGAKYRNGTDGANGTGGLLIIYSNEFINNGSLTAKGSTGGYGTSGGGSSGGGSINVFVKHYNSSKSYNDIKGNTNATSPTPTSQYSASGGKGGNGTVNIGVIKSGNYYDLNTAISEGINNTLSNRMMMSSMRSVRSVNPSILEDNNPIINVNDAEVTIDYQDELTREYSLDYGETWISYVGPFVLEENTTIIARSVDSEDKVVNASTYTVTSIKKEETKSEETTTTTTTTTTQPTTTTSVETTTTTVVTTENVVDIPERRDEDEETNE